MTAFFAFIVAMFVTIVLMPPLMRAAQRFAFIDEPDQRKVHTCPIPRIGGVAMVTGAVIPMLLWLEPLPMLRGYLFGVAVLLAFGLWDDRSGLDYRLKFLGQFIAVGLAVFDGGIVVHFVPFGDLDPIPVPASIALTLFALLGVTNAINLADGLDGLAAGTTLLSLGVIVLLAYIGGDPVLLLMAMAVMGAIVGFLRFNTHPAQVFMGDAGSQFLGYSVGVLVIILTQQTNPALSPAMPLLLLGLPLIDTLLVMAERLRAGRSPFRPDRNHIHHKLLARGLDHYESVVVIYAVQGLLVTAAFVFRYNTDLLVTGTFLAALIVLAVLGRPGAALLPRRPVGVPGAITRVAERLKRQAIQTRGPTMLAAVSLPLGGLFVAARLPALPVDGRVTLCALLGAALAGLAWRRLRPDIALVERLVLYVAMTAMIYYWCSARSQAGVLALVENVYFGVLGVGLLVAYRYGQSSRLGVTPTDFLIVLIALLVPTFARTLLPQPHVAEVGIKTLVAFYAAELVLGAAGPRAGWMRLALTGVLAVVVLRLLGGDIVAT
ncbi:MAG: glycosyltransferase family 4 protein [Gammaproteobacteria bacterium]